jgi:hypothetical protein
VVSIGTLTEFVVSYAILPVDIFFSVDATISFIAPNYDGAEHLRTSLLSVFGQIYPDCEVILVDDGSIGEFRF